jgi:anti-sigma B factor antagonist
MEFDVDVRTDRDVVIVDVVGEVDLYTAPRLEEALTGASAGAPPLVVVHLARATYLDSTALRVLTTSLRRIRERGGEIALVSTQPKVAKLFAITGLDQLFPLCATEAEALETVRAHSPRRP